MRGDAKGTFVTCRGSRTWLPSICEIFLLFLDGIGSPLSGTIESEFLNHVSTIAYRAQELTAEFHWSRKFLKVSFFERAGSGD